MDEADNFRPEAHEISTVIVETVVRITIKRSQIHGGCPPGPLCQREEPLEDDEVGYVVEDIEVGHKDGLRASHKDFREVILAEMNDELNTAIDEGSSAIYCDD